MKKILIILMLVGLYGCSSVSGLYEADPLFKQQSDLLEADTDIVDVKKLQQRVNAVSDEKSRNALLEDLLTISDRSCARHQASIMAGLNTWNVSTGSLSNLLSAVGTVVGGESAKAALAAGATFTNSTRSLVNEEVYAKALGTTIVRATVSAREKQFAVISKGMSSSMDDYSVQSGLRDVYNYQNRCSFYYGLLEITKALDQRKRSKSEIEDLIFRLNAKSDELKNRGGDVSEINKKIEALILELEGAPH
ncbi:hypothetical protein KIH87_16830 [Paraneptunicella aestuarii]|uniref:hypothetical protein n=1 Tax=Paraneptunicella aestuarii TaxID=2831148 RepID=UPI001E3D35D3|nr:hypothetical protein [Paraneptunicella aestuarii]UAA38330.1 hypothetical protein KIH87_16830 [Paraneptunicella aestuarii]